MIRTTSKLSSRIRRFKPYRSLRTESLEDRCVLSSFLSLDTQDALPLKSTFSVPSQGNLHAEVPQLIQYAGVAATALEKTDVGLTGKGSGQGGSGPEGGDDHGNNSASSTLIGSFSNTGGNTEIDGDQDWFSFYVEAGAQVTLETTLGTHFDTTLTLFGTDGATTLDFNDDIDLVGGNRASRINFTFPASGQYYAAVAGFSSFTGTYNLSLTHVDDHGRDSASATYIEGDTVTPGVIEVGGNLDWFVLSASAGAQVTLETQLGTQSDTTLTLYASDGITPLAFNDDIDILGGNLASRINYTFAATGFYYVQVTEFGAPNQTGTYNLAFDYVDDHGNDANFASFFGSTFPAAGTIEVGGDADWFTFFGAAGAQVTLETTLGSLSDTTLELIGSDGVTQLAFNDDIDLFGGNLASRITLALPSRGQYYAVVRGFSSNVGSYGMSINYVDDHGNNSLSASPSVVGLSSFGTIEVTGDRDWFAFNVIPSVQYNIETSLGTLSDSTIQLVDTNGSTPLAFNDDIDISNGNLASRIRYTFPAAGPYFVDLRPFSPSFDAGTYSLRISLLGDFTFDGIYNCADINELSGQIAAGSTDLKYDLNGDLAVTLADQSTWLSAAGALNLGPGRSYLPGDANLSGAVDGSDFGIWNANKFTFTTNWCSGNFDGSTAVDGSDFGIWNANKFQSSDAGNRLVGGESSVAFMSVVSQPISGVGNESAKLGLLNPASATSVTRNALVTFADARQQDAPSGEAVNTARSTDANDAQEKRAVRRRALDRVFAEWTR